jgi:hypothetical protein
MMLEEMDRRDQEWAKGTYSEGWEHDHAVAAKVIRDNISNARDWPTLSGKLAETNVQIETKFGKRPLTARLISPIIMQVGKNPGDPEEVIYPY